MNIDQYAARLEAQWRAGHFTALIEVVALFGWNQRPLPAWAAEAAVRQLERAYNGDRPHAGDGERNGRSSSVMAFEDMSTKHRARWNRVRFRLGPAGVGAAMRRAWWRLHGIKRRDDVFDIVSADLKKTPARGAPGTIKDSYKLVEAAIKRGDGARFKVGG